MEINVEWTWEDTGGGKAYADHLVIVFYASGRHRRDRAWETTDGYRLRIDAGYGEVKLEKGIKGEYVADLIQKKFIEASSDGVKVVEKHDKSSTTPSIHSGQNGKNWYRVQLCIKGRKICVCINGVKVMDVEHDFKVKHGRIGVGNRESNANVQMISFIRRFEVSGK